MLPRHETGGDPSCDKPLLGLRVLDLSRVLAGPFAAQVLADLGADVVKAESPEGDVTRRWGPPFVGDTATYFFSANRGSRSVRIALDDPAGQASVRRLIQNCDVVLHNFLPASAARFGLDEDSIRALNPDAVVCVISGFGRGSSHADRPAYDLIIQAISGLMSITGEPQIGPTKVGVAVVDVLAGLFTVIAALSGVQGRRRSGRGMSMNVSLLGSAVAALVNQSSSWLNAGVEPELLGNHHPNIVPYGTFQCSDGRLAVACGSDRHFALFAEVLGFDLAVATRFATNATRVDGREELIAMIEAHTASRSLAELHDELERVGVPAAPVLSLPEALSSPEVNDLGLVHTRRYGDREIELVATPIDLGDGHGSAISRRPPPRLGEHDDDLEEILREWSPSPSVNTNHEDQPVQLTRET